MSLHSTDTDSSALNPEKQKKVASFSEEKILHDFVAEKIKYDPRIMGEISNDDKTSILGEYATFLSESDSRKDLLDAFRENNNAGKNKVFETIKRIGKEKTVIFRIYHENAVKKILQVAVKDFDLDSKEVRGKKVHGALKNMPLLQLEDLIGSGNEENLKNFLKEQLGKDIKYRDIADTLKKLGFSSDAQIIPPLQEAFDKMQKGKKVPTGTFREILLDKNISSKSQLGMLYFFYPNISLKELGQIGLISEGDITAHKKRLLGSSNISPESVDSGKILMNTKEYIKNASDFTKLVTKGSLDFLIDDYNNVVEGEQTVESVEDKQVAADFCEKIERFGGGMRGFKKVILSDENISSIIKESFDNFQVGNFIHLQFTEKTGIKKDIFSQIDSIYTTENGASDDLASSVRLKNLNERGLDGINFSAKSGFTTTSLVNFYQLLRKYSAQNFSLEFATKEKLEKKEKKNEIKDYTNVHDIKDLDDLKQKIDNIDPEGIDIPLKENEVVLEYNDGGKIENYLITKIHESSKTITLNGNSSDRGSFEELFAKMNASNGKIKRKKPNESLEAVFSGLGENFGGLTYLGKNRIGPSEKKDKPKYEGVEYFIGENGNALRVKKVGKDFVDFDFGEYKEGKPGSKKEGMNEEPSVFKKQDSFSGLDEFHRLLKNHNMKPKYPKITDPDESKKEFKEKGGFFGKLATFSSFAEVLKGGENVVEFIKGKLEQGNRYKSAKMSLAMMRVMGFSPDSALFLDARAKLDGEEKNLAEEITKQLTNLGSKDMMIRIRKILENKNSELYMIEAAMMACLGKYGNLYPKGLGYDRGSFIWYKKFGGAKNDAFFMKKKSECEGAQNDIKGKKDDPVPFTEESLLESYIGKLEKEGKVRSRLDKNFGSTLKQGIREEMEDGKTKCGNSVTIAGAIDYVLGEFKEGGATDANGVGAMESLFAKNSSIENMQAVPFILTMSGLARNFDQEILKTICINYAFTTPYTALRFNVSSAQIRVFQKTMIEGLRMKGHEALAQELQGMISDTNPRGSFDKLQRFWFSNSAVLLDIMLLKDGTLIANQEENANFSAYISTVKGVQGDGEFNIDQDKVEGGWLDKGFTPLSGGLLRHVRSDTAGAYGGEMSRLIAFQYFKYLDSIKTLDVDEKTKEALFKNTFGPFQAKVRESLGKYRDGDGDFAEQYRNRNLIFHDTAVDPDNLGTAEYQAFLTRAWEKFYHSTTSESSVSDTKEKVHDITSLTDEKILDFSTRQKDNSPSEDSSFNPES